MIAALLAISIYCTSPGPTLSNANLPTTVNSALGNINSYTCATGYTTSGPTEPYYTCLAGNATNGIWSAPAYSYNRILF